MDNLVLFSFIRKVVFALHLVFYGFWILPVIINAETWYYGVKFNGEPALIIQFTIGIVGLVLGYFIYKKYRYAYVTSLIPFGIVISSTIVNHLKL